MSETKWKNNKFSATNIDDEFQVSNMKYKIKKIKEKKNTKKTQIIKKQQITTKIQGIEPLRNIHDISDDREGVQEGFFFPHSQGNNHCKNPDDPYYDPNIDPDCDFEGYDVPDRKEDMTFWDRVIAFVEYIYALIFMINFTIAYYISVYLSIGFKPGSDKKYKSEDEEDKLLVDIANKINQVQDVEVSGPQVAGIRSISDIFNYVSNLNFSDIFLIMNFLGWFESIIFGSYAAFNWYYVLYYHEPMMNELGEPIMIPIVDKIGNPVVDKEGNQVIEQLGRRVRLTDFFYRNNLTCAAAGAINIFSKFIPAEFWLIFNFFCLPSMFFLESLQYFLRNIVSCEMYEQMLDSNNQSIGWQKRDMLFSQAFYFTLIFIFVTIFLHEYANSFRLFLLELFNFNFKDFKERNFSTGHGSNDFSETFKYRRMNLRSLITIMYICVIYVLFSIIYRGDIHCKVQDIPQEYLGSEERTNKLNQINETLKTVSGKNMYMTAIYIFFIVILNIIRIMNALTIAVPLGAFCCIVYLLIITFFGFIMFKPFTFPTITISNILKYITKRDLEGRRYLSEDKDSIYNRVLKVLYEVGDFVYKFSYTFAFLAVFITFFYKFNSEIHQQNLNINLTTSMGIGILSVLSILYSGIVDIVIKYNKSSGLEFYQVFPAPILGNNIESITSNPYIEDKPKEKPNNLLRTIMFYVVTMVIYILLFYFVYKGINHRIGGNKNFLLSPLFWIVFVGIIGFIFINYLVFSILFNKNNVNNIPTSELRPFDNIR